MEPGAVNGQEPAQAHPAAHVARDTAIWPRVAQDLLERIVDGEFKPGRELPPLASLLEGMDVSHYVLRQAVRYLAQHQIVRGGRGHRFTLTSSARIRAEDLIARMQAAAPAEAKAEDARPDPAAIRQIPGPQNWKRVANLLLTRIGSGQYSSWLPGKTALAEETGFSERTVGRALGELAGRDLIYRVIGRSYHVNREAFRAASGRGIGLDELVLAWGADYHLEQTGGLWQAWRLDGAGQPLTAATAEELNAMIRAESERMVAVR